MPPTPQPSALAIAKAVDKDDKAFAASVKAIAQMLDTSGRIKVIRAPDGSTWYVDMRKRLLYYNPIMQGKRLTREQMLYLIAHEVGHFLYSRPWTNPKDVKQAEYTSLVNAGEDMRMERPVASKFKGFSDLRNTFTPAIIEERLRDPRTSREDACWLYAMLAELNQFLNASWNWEGYKAYEDTARMWNDALRANDTQELSDRIRPIYDYLYPPAPPGDGDGTGGTGEGDGESDSQDAPPDDGDDDTGGQSAGDDDGDDDASDD